MKTKREKSGDVLCIVMYIYGHINVILIHSLPKAIKHQLRPNNASMKPIKWTPFEYQEVKNVEQDTLKIVWL